jgi:hypothetical protein
MDSSHTFDSGKGKGTRKFGVAFVVGRSKERNVLDFKAVEETICTLGMKTKLYNISCI